MNKKQKILQLTRSRYDKAQVIAASRQIYKIRGDADHRLVESETEDGKFYRAGVSGCDCPDFVKRGATCKHMIAITIKESS